MGLIGWSWGWPRPGRGRWQSSAPGLTPEQIDVWEVHEAFSAQALGVLLELPNQLGGFTIPDEKLTPNGGAVAIGHPFGATGTRYVLTLATALRNARYGSGHGDAVVVENPNAG